MQKMPVRISNILKLWKSVDVRYPFLRLVSKLVIKKYQFFKMGIMVRYRKVSIPEKGIDTQH